jgi:N-methylhydantoinase A/oxoprolinase/acetone carboxylase beta subunit
MLEIGAGGGSIAKINVLKGVSVGPEGAGSEPGPLAIRAAARGRRSPGPHMPFTCCSKVTPGMHDKHFGKDFSSVL